MGLRCSPFDCDLKNIHIFSEENLKMVAMDNYVQSRVVTITTSVEEIVRIPVFIYCQRKLKTKRKNKQAGLGGSVVCPSDW